MAVNIAFSQLTFGPKIGYNTSKLSTEISDIKTELRNSPQIGFFLRMGKKIYLQPEINWLVQGGLFDGFLGGDGEKFSQTIHLNTLRVPLLIGHRLINLKVISLRAHLGPAASIVVNKDIDTYEGKDYIEPIKESNLQDIIWSAQVGVSMDILMLMLDIRYNFGISKVIKDVDYNNEQYGFDSRANGFTVSLAWKIL